MNDTDENRTNHFTMRRRREGSIYLHNYVKIKLISYEKNQKIGLLGQPKNNQHLSLLGPNFAFIIFLLECILFNRKEKTL